MTSLSGVDGSASKGASHRAAQAAVGAPVSDDVAPAGADGPSPTTVERIAGCALTDANPPLQLSAVEHVQRPSALSSAPHLTRALTWWSLTSLGVGSTIGAGIFVMTGLVANTLTGPALSLSFIVASIACGLTGLAYAEFASITPSAGSAYAYTRATMGQTAAFFIGHNLTLEYTVAAAAVAQSWSQYLNELLRLFSVRIPDVISKPPFEFDSKTNVFRSNGCAFDLPALLISVFITILLVCGVRESARFNNIMVAVKVSIVLFVIGLGASLVNTANWSPFAPFGYLGLSFFGKNVASQMSTSDGHATGMLAGAAIVFFSYIGFDSVSCHAEEAKKPERDVPMALLLSLSISTLLYVGVSIVLTGMLPYDKIDATAPLSTAFSQRGYSWAAYLVAVGAVAGMTSVLLVSMLSQPRIFLAMSRDGLLPKFLGDIHPRFHTPWKATVLTGTCVALVSSFIPLTILVEFVSIGTLLAFGFVCVAVIILRHTAPKLDRPFRCPWVPFLPGLGALFCLLLMFSLPATNWYRLFAWFGLGLIIYLCYGRGHGLGQRYRIPMRDEIDGICPPPESLPHDSPPTLGKILQVSNASAGDEPRMRSATESAMAKRVLVPASLHNNEAAAPTPNGKQPAGTKTKEIEMVEVKLTIEEERANEADFAAACGIDDIGNLPTVRIHISARSQDASATTP